MKPIFVISTTYTKSLEEVGKFRQEHFNFIQKNIDAGKFMAGGRQNPPTGGLILAYNVTKSELEEILKEDPYYKNDLIETVITEFTPALFDEDLKKLQENIYGNNLRLEQERINFKYLQEYLKKLENND